MMSQVERARGAIGELAGQARLLDNADLVIEALARREAVLGSRIEGTTTQMGELLLQEALDPPVAEDSDLREVLNYLSTIRLAQAWLAEGRTVGLPLVKDLHSHLLTGVRGERKHPGEVRRGAVFIGARGLEIEEARFVPLRRNKLCRCSNTCLNSSVAKARTVRSLTPHSHTINSRPSTRSKTETVDWVGS